MSCGALITVSTEQGTLSVTFSVHITVAKELGALKQPEKCRSSTADGNVYEYNATLSAQAAVKSTGRNNACKPLFKGLTISELCSQLIRAALVGLC